MILIKRLYLLKRRCYNSTQWDTMTEKKEGEVSEAQSARESSRAAQRPPLPTAGALVWLYLSIATLNSMIRREYE